APPPRPTGWRGVVRRRGYRAHRVGVVAARCLDIRFVARVPFLGSARSGGGPWRARSLHSSRPLWSTLWRREHGTFLATRSAFTGSNRPVSRARPAAAKTLVRRAAAPAHARALRRKMDRR